MLWIIGVIAAITQNRLQVQKKAQKSQTIRQQGMKT
jgi:hypothetical protein